MAAAGSGPCWTRTNDQTIMSRKARDGRSAEKTDLEGGNVDLEPT